jgi:hypothetical protein
VAIAESDLDAVRRPAVAGVGLDDRAAARVVERGGGGLVKGGTSQRPIVVSARSDRDACAATHDGESDRPAGDPSRSAIHAISFLPTRFVGPRLDRVSSTSRRSGAREGRGTSMSRG